MTAGLFELQSDKLSEGLGGHAPRVLAFTGEESTSAAYRFSVAVACPVDAVLLASLEQQALGQPAALVFHDAGGVARRRAGMIGAVRVEPASADGSAAVLHVELVARLALLRLRTHSRIFQHRSVVEIVTEVLEAWGVAHLWRLTGSPPRREYCTQYRETDHDFVLRLLASEGIFFYFEQRENEGEQMVLLDSAHTYPATPQAGAVASEGGVGASPTLRVTARAEESPDGVEAFRLERALMPQAVLLGDFDFRKPRLPLRALADAEADREGVAVPAVDAALLSAYLHADTGELESDAGAAEVDAARAAMCLDSLRAGATTAHGTSRCARLAAGHAFLLEGHPVDALNRYWVVTGLRHVGRLPELGGEGAGEVPYRNELACAPAEIALRPPLPSPRLVQVTETALVTGPAGEEIHTDEHGRIKVQFHWDLAGGHDDRSSCWLRVSQPWSGVGWGAQFMPRVGAEVLVSFLGGDVDRPIVIGSVYNGTHPAPFALPEQRTRTGLRTQSTPGGGGYNELSFEDRAGEEQVYLRAEREMRVEVGGDSSERVDGDQQATTGGRFEQRVFGDHEVHVLGKSAHLAAGDHQLLVTGSALRGVSGNADERVSGDRTTRVEGRERVELFGPGLAVYHRDATTRIAGHAVTVVGTDEHPRSATTFVQGTSELSATGTSELISETAIVLRCGDSSIRLTPDAIELNAPALRLFADEAYLTAEERLKVHAKQEALLKSDKIMLKSEGARISLNRFAKVNGELVKLNCEEDETDESMPDREPIEPTVIRLADDDGKPLARKRFVVLLADGTERAGVLDDAGEAHLELPSSGEVSFFGVDNPRRK